MKAAGAICILVLLAGGCASGPPKPVSVQNMTTVAATIESVDVDKRLVSLRGDDGRTATVEVTPEVRNLDQVKPGDKVVVRYYKAIGAAFKEKGQSTTLHSLDTTTGAMRAEPGQKPGAAVGSTVTTTVVIDAVDKASNTVAFRGPSGMLRSVEVKDPEARKFIAHLKKGDEVEVTYTEALAVSVEPAS